MFSNPHVWLFLILTQICVVAYGQKRTVELISENNDIQPVPPNQDDSLKDELLTEEINTETFSYTYLTNAISKLEKIVEARCVFLFMTSFKWPVLSFEAEDLSDIKLIYPSEIHIMISQAGYGAIEYFEVVLETEQSHAVQFVNRTTSTYDTIVQNYFTDEEKLVLILINSHFRSLLLREVTSALLKNVASNHADTVRLLLTSQAEGLSIDNRVEARPTPKAPIKTGSRETRVGP